MVILPRRRALNGKRSLTNMPSSRYNNLRIPPVRMQRTVRLSLMRWICCTRDVSMVLLSFQRQWFHRIGAAHPWRRAYCYWIWWAEDPDAFRNACHKFIFTELLRSLPSENVETKVAKMAPVKIPPRPRHPLTPRPLKNNQPRCFPVNLSCKRSKRRAMIPDGRI